MQGRLVTAVVTAAFLVVPAACTWLPAAPPPKPGPEPIWEGGATAGYIELADALRAEELRIRRGGRIRQPFFSVEGQVLWVESDWAESHAVQVFDYPGVASRAEESAAIAPDGSRIGSKAVDWDTPPHFWARGSRIVLYTGTDPEIIGALTRALDRRPVVGPR